MRDGSQHAHRKHQKGHSVNHSEAFSEHLPTAGRRIALYFILYRRRVLFACARAHCERLSKLNIAPGTLFCRTTRRRWLAREYLFYLGAGKKAYGNIYVLTAFV